MTRTLRGVLTVILSTLVGAACDKSTSGGHREADAEDLETGGGDSGGSKSSGGSSVAGTSGRGGTSAGGTSAGGTSAGGASTGGSGGGPVLPPCLDCAANDCPDEVLACGTACEPFIACLLECADTDWACENACMAASDDDRVTAVTTCMREECGDVCGRADDLGDAARRQAEVDCGRFESCGAPFFVYNYGELATCVERATSMIEWLGALEDTGLTPVALDACAGELAELSCEQYFSLRVPRIGCLIPGKRALGESCRNGVQCASGFCPSVGFACATCAPMPHEGDACSKPEDCAAGLVCTASGGTAGVCTVPARAGESCGTARPCDAYLDCIDATCIPYQTALGAACGSTSAANCDAREGFTCSSSTTGTCSRFTPVPLGAACGLSDGAYQVCADLGQCVNARCVEGPELGDPCSPTGPFCQWPEQCVGSRCVGPPRATECMAQSEAE